MARSTGVTYVYETQTKTNIAVIFVLFVIVVCYDWVLTHIVSAVTFAEPKKVDFVFSVLPVCCILRCLGEVIFSVSFCKHVACESQVCELLPFY